MIRIKVKNCKDVITEDIVLCAKLAAARAAVLYPQPADPAACFSLAEAIEDRTGVILTVWPHQNIPGECYLKY